ncbi:MAG: 6-carboxytetrahydropterin synthase QueD [Candidatus Omnitrophica bacterium]|nr:6-carboxytetrahydropterin synthase QueD [Candidatus Omnitrophota bacterium]
MYKIKIESSFSAAHNLRGYKGKCENLHGHNWKVAVEVAADNLDKAGMVLDFKDLKMKLNRVLEKLDHKYFNRMPYFKKVNPTSENIARYIYDNLSSRVAGLLSVTVWESNNSCATYYG